MALLNEEGLGIIINAVHAYVNKYYGTNAIDYYDMFGIDRNLPSKQILEILNEGKYKIIFHPDMLSNVPEHLKPYFQQVCEYYKDFQYIMENERKRIEYDKGILKEQKKDKHAPDEFSDQRKDVFDIFGKYVLVTLARYGQNHTTKAVRDYLSNNYLDAFTRTQGARDNIAGLKQEVMITILLNCYGTNSPSELAHLVIEDAKRFGAATLEKAAISTYQKYGYEHCKWALSRLMNENNSNSFTNDNNARVNLSKSEITINTLPFLIACELNMEQFVNTPEFRSMYPKMIEDYAKVIEMRVAQKKEYGYK